MNLLLAVTSEAEQAGRVVGVIIGICVGFGLLISCAVAFTKAFTSRTPGWIVAGSVGGVLLVVIGVSFTVSFVTGFLRARQRSLPPGDTAGFTAPVTASTAAQIIQGKDVPYKIVLPAGWAVMSRSANNFDVMAARRDLYFGVIAEEGMVGASSTLLDIAQAKLKTIATDLHLGETSTVRIDGRDWLQFSAKCQFKNMPIAYHYDVYAGPEGSYQVVGWTLQNLYDRDVGTMRDVAATFRFPSVGNPPAAAASSPTSPPQTVNGNSLAYKLTVPADWTVKPAATTFDVEAFHRSLYVGVAAEEGSVGTPRAALDLSQNILRKAATNLELGPASTVKIDGRDWLQFTAKCQIKNIPFAYQYFVYAGPEGTFRVICWTMQNLYDRDAGTMRDVATTFRFPPTAATPTPAASPTTRSTPALKAKER